jgi:predicted transposase YbfD/YdcC
MLDIRGKLITTDAMGCQKNIAEKIRDQEGDYLFSVKGNQGKLNKAFEEHFPLKEINNPKYDSYTTSEKVMAEKKCNSILSVMCLTS